MAATFEVMDKTNWRRDLGGMRCALLASPDLSPSLPGHHCPPPSRVKQGRLLARLESPARVGHGGMVQFGRREDNLSDEVVLAHLIVVPHRDCDVHLLENGHQEKCKMYWYFYMKPLYNLV